jgi:histidinol phosphatase-like enzyme
MSRAPELVVLDRDGVLNRLVVHRAGGSPESPHVLAEVEILPGVADALRRLTDAGVTVALATNQPAAAKGQVTREELDRIHAAIVLGSEQAGGRIAGSFICFHRAEDGCGRPHRRFVYLLPPRRRRLCLPEAETRSVARRARGDAGCARRRNFHGG